MSATILDQLWEEQVPIRSHNGIGFDIDAFGLGLLADAGEGGLVFLFLERACHYGLLSRRRSCDLVFVLDFRARSFEGNSSLDKPRHIGAEDPPELYLIERFQNAWRIKA